MPMDVLPLRPLRRRRWLLVEQPGAWGSHDPRDSDLPPAVAEELMAWAAAAGWDVRLIRRSRRHRLEGRLCVLVDAARGDARMHARRVDDPRRIIDLAAGGGPPATGPGDGGPIYAVEARPDGGVLRRRRANPVADALRRLRPEATWEISRAGDDEGPAALVVLPEMLLYGRIGPAAVPAVVAAHERGELALEWAGGRVGDPWEVRVAEHLVRRSTGRAAIADLARVEVARHGDDEATVVLGDDEAGTLEVRVRRSRADEVGRPVCSGACGASVRYELVSMRVASLPACDRSARSIA